MRHSGSPTICSSSRFPAKPTSSRRRARAACCSSTADRRSASDALMKAVAGLPGGGPVHTLFNTHWHPEQTGSNERARQGRQDDHRAREHAAVADDRRHLAVERTAVQAAAEDRAAEQDLLHDRQARLGRSLRLHPRCGAHRRRSVRVLPAAERARRGRRGLGPGLAGRRLGDRRLDWRHRRRPSAAADAGQRGDAHRARRADRCSAWQISRRSPRCTATIYDRLTQLLNKGRGPERGGGGAADEGIRCADGESATSSCAARSRACGHTCRRMRRRG